MADLRVGQLVVATPGLTDPNFSRTVVMLLQADPEDGGLGVVLNRPTGTGLSEVLPAWADLGADPPVVFGGGPVARTGAICLARSALGGGRSARPGRGHDAAYSALDGVPGGVVGTIDLDRPPDLVRATVEHVRVFAGYAGWSPGQLESEVGDGSWWVLDSLPDDPFDARPEQLWSRVLRRQGPPIAFAAGYPADPTLN